MSKYRINMTDLTRPGGIAKLERDGFKRHEIMGEFHKQTKGASNKERDPIVNNLFNLKAPC